MSGNAQKTAFARSANELAYKRANDAISAGGKELPCTIVSVTGWIVTVKFQVQGPFTLPNLTLPVASSLYDYLPFQVGDPGCVRAADARLGGLSELGTGTAKYPATVGNLSALVFEPFGKKSWSPPDNPNLRVVQGPDGVIIQDLESDSTITLLKTSIVLKRGDDVTATLTADHAELAFGSTGLVKVSDNRVDLKGELYINGNKYLDHKHSGVQVGGANSGVVVP